MKTLILLFTIFLNSLSAQQMEDAVFSKLSGKWINESQTKTTIELWVKLDNKIIKGQGLTIDNNTRDTIFTEDLLISEMGGEIFYIAKVSENNFPVSFLLTEITDTSLTFENKTHNFPQLIKYSFSLDKTLSVDVKAQNKGFTLLFKKEEN